MSYVQGSLRQNDVANRDVEKEAQTRAEYVRFTKIIPSNVNRIKLQVREINQLVSKLGTNVDTTAFRSTLHDLQHNTNRLCQETVKHIKDVTNLPLPKKESERKAKKIQIDKLRVEFEEALNLFQDAQNESAAKEKQEVARVRALSSSSQDLGFGHPVRAQENIQLQELTTVDIRELQEREEGLRKLEDDILTVNQIFKDLASMVQEQGEVIDSIEAHVVQTEELVTKGNNELDKAATHKKSARKKKLILAAVIICVLVVIAVIIAVSV